MVAARGILPCLAEEIVQVEVHLMEKKPVRSREPTARVRPALMDQMIASEHNSHSHCVLFNGGSRIARTQVHSDHYISEILSAIFYLSMPKTPT